jgi:hypothetical protein
MMQIENLDNDIVRQLENNGLKKSDKEQQIKLLLTLTYMAVKMYWSMSPEDRVLVSDWHKKFTRFYSLKNFLKERQRSSRKKSSPPAPPYLDKEVQDKDEIPSLSPAREKRTLKVRQELFWNELLTFEGEYDRQMLLAFYYYWSEQVTGRRKMRLELETSWETKKRLKGWAQRSFNKNDEAAALHLEREKKKTAKQTANVNEQQVIAAKREEDNAKLEREIKERKASAVSYEEYLKMKEGEKKLSLKHEEGRF